ncbi:MAG: hypothetical protein KIT73_10145 [Burkholderiales bacterium]|nr:hypothetical protein [Burkholderiales bacterium]
MQFAPWRVTHWRHPDGTVTARESRIVARPFVSAVAGKPMVSIEGLPGDGVELSADELLHLSEQLCSLAAFVAGTAEPVRCSRCGTVCQFLAAAGHRTTWQCEACEYVEVVVHV